MLSTRRPSASYFGAEEYHGYGYRDQDAAVDFKTAYENSTAAMNHYKEKLTEVDPRASEALERGHRILDGQNADQICLSYKKAMATAEWQTDQQKLDAALGVAKESFQPAYEDLINTYPDGAPQSILDGIADDVRNFVTALLNDAADIAIAAGTMLDALVDATAFGAGNDYIGGDLKGIRTLDDTLTTNMRPSGTDDTPQPQAPDTPEVNSTS